MFTQFLKKLNLGLGFIAIALLFAVVTLRAHKNVTDEDTLFHIRTGQYIVQNGVPITDIFSFSIAGQPWLNHQWLWQVIVYTVYKIFGEQGIVTLQVFIALTIFIILFFLGYRKDRILLVVGLLFMGMLVDPNRTLIRPDIVSLLFALVEISILWLFLKRSWLIYLLFILQVLWVNIHGFFILGPLFIFLIWFAESVKRFIPLPYDWNSIGRLSDDEYHRLLKIGVVLLVAGFMNLQFIDGFLYPFKILLGDPQESKFMFSYIGELHRSVSRGNILDPHHHLYYKILIIFSFFGFILNWRKIDLRVLMLWLFFLCFSWGAVRNMLFFVPVAYLSIIQNLSHIRFDDSAPMSKRKFILKHTIHFALLIGLIFWIGSRGKEMLAFQNFDFESGEFTSAYGQLSTQKYPRKAQKFLTEHNIQGNFFNNLSIGHYLISQNYPNIRVFIDGRTEAYGAEFFKMFREIDEDGNWEVFQKQVKKFNITGVFLSFLNKQTPVKLLNQIHADPDWKLIYFDYDAVIFLKDVPQNKEAIKRLSVDLSQWKTKPADALLLRHVESAMLYRNRANTLHDLGFNEQAANELAEAIRIQPAHLETILSKAHIEHSRGRNDQALSLYKQALQLFPRSLTVMRQLAFMYESMNDYSSAMNVGQKMIRQAPRDPRGYFVLSRAFAQTSRYEESFSSLIQAHQFHLGKTDILTVSDILLRKKESSWAKKVCALVYPDGQDMNETCRLIGMDG